MKPLLWELNRILEKKIALCDEFISLLRQEWDAHTRYSLPDIEAASQKKEKLAARVQALEEVRKALMERIEHRLDVRARGLTLRALLRIQDHPINRDLARNRETLLEQIRTINHLNGQARALMDRSALSFKKSLAFLHATVEKAGSPYHADGRLGEAKNQGRLLSTDV
jgi:flagellar biosynthesis/type III secretory pathway chaperone